MKQSKILTYPSRRNCQSVSGSAMWAPLTYEVESIQNSSRLKNDTNLYDIFHETRDLLEGRNIPIYPFFGLIFL